MSLKSQIVRSVTESSERATSTLIFLFLLKGKECAKPICGEYNAIPGSYYHSAEPSVLLIDKRNYLDF